MHDPEFKLYATVSAKDREHGRSVCGAMIKAADGSIVRHVKPISANVVLTDDIKRLSGKVDASVGVLYQLTRIVGSVGYSIETLQNNVLEFMDNYKRNTENQLLDENHKYFESVRAKLSALTRTINIISSQSEEKAKDYLLNQSATIFEYMESIDSFFNYIIGKLEVLSPFHIIVLRQIYLFSTIKVRIYFLMGQKDQAVTEINKSSNYIKSIAKSLLQKWTVGVDLTLSEDNDTDQFFQDMSEIDGVLPFDRQCKCNQTRAQFSPRIINAKEALELTDNSETRNFPMISKCIHVMKGDIIRAYEWDNYNCYIALESGYLVSENNSLSYRDNIYGYRMFLSNTFPRVTPDVVKNIQNLSLVVKDALSAINEAELAECSDDIAGCIPSLVIGPQAQSDTMLLLADDSIFDNTKND